MVIPFGRVVQSILVNNDVYWRGRGVEQASRQYGAMRNGTKQGAFVRVATGRERNNGQVAVPSVR